MKTKTHTAPATAPESASEMNLIVRCSELHKLMTKAQGKSPRDKYTDAIDSLHKKEQRLKSMNPETKTASDLREGVKKLKAEIKALKPYKDDLLLSDTCRTWLKEKAAEHVYGYKIQIENKYLSKGIMVEDDSIELLNSVFFTDYQKNTERKNATVNGVEWLTGECDIDTGEEIRDVKSSWSLETFPKFKEDAEKKVKASGYDWQMRGYMLLWDHRQAVVDFCLVDTPPELLSDYDDWDLHEVDHIEPSKRITSVLVERDLDLESEMIERYTFANRFYKECIVELINK